MLAAVPLALQLALLHEVLVKMFVQRFVKRFVQVIVKRFVHVFVKDVRKCEQIYDAGESPLIKENV